MRICRTIIGATPSSKSSLRICAGVCPRGVAQRARGSFANASRRDARPDLRRGCAGYFSAPFQPTVRLAEKSPRCAESSPQHRPPPPPSRKAVREQRPSRAHFAYREASARRYSRRPRGGDANGPQSARGASSSAPRRQPPELRRAFAFAEPCRCTTALSLPASTGPSTPS